MSVKPPAADPEVSSAVIASRQRWSRWTAQRLLRDLERAGKARRVVRRGRSMLVAKSSVVAEAVPGFHEPGVMERDVAELKERVTELEARLDRLARRSA